MRPLRGTRIAKREQGGKTLSYLESWDVRAHLIRVFGFGNFDAEVIEYHHVADRTYMGGKDKDREMVEVIYSARVMLHLRDAEQNPLATYTECAVGSTSGPASMLGEHHDNALKTAASDALKRCAINLGSQFGLGLYDQGSTREVVRSTVVVPEGYEKPDPEAEAIKNVEHAVGGQVIGEGNESEQITPSQEESQEAAASA